MNTAERISLPTEIVETIQNFGRTSVSIRRGLMHELREFMDEFPDPGYKMILYDLIADAWNDTTGEHKSARTLRFWMQSVTAFSKEQLSRYSALSDAQLIVACELAIVAKTTPQEICDWCVDRAVGSVREMRSHWLPQTTDGYTIDHPIISGLLRGVNKNWQSHPRYSRLLRIVNLLRAEIKAIQERN
jgi:hypothetical protein